MPIALMLLRDIGRHLGLGLRLFTAAAPPSLQEIALTLLLSLRFMSLVFEEVSAFIGIGLDLPGIGRDLFCDGLWYWGLIGSRYLCLNQCRLFHPWCGPWCAMCGALMCYVMSTNSPSLVSMRTTSNL